MTCSSDTSHARPCVAESSAQARIIGVGPHTYSLTGLPSGRWPSAASSGTVIRPRMPALPSSVASTMRTPSFSKMSTQ